MKEENHSDMISVCVLSSSDVFDTSIKSRRDGVFTSLSRDLFTSLSSVRFTSLSRALTKTISSEFFVGCLTSQQHVTVSVFHGRIS